ncbi:hypothetical protein [uncultured Clostridium sp.]|uniref:hypothetical protein n=1 Tax=uncultured Clostridium sp. TaxID=59620 RepID=UPI002619E317|nr:hypothetical protein [uncultured Clostridium sp.]
MEKGFRIINYTILKIFNILVGVPLAFALTTVVLSVCLVDLILLLLPIFWLCNVMLKDIVVIVVPTNMGIQLVFTIVGTLMGYYLNKILKVYVPKWFKGMEMYIEESFSFSINKN